MINQSLTQPRVIKHRNLRAFPIPGILIKLICFTFSQILTLLWRFLNRLFTFTLLGLWSCRKHANCRCLMWKQQFLRKETKCKRSHKGKTPSRHQKINTTTFLMLSIKVYIYTRIKGRRKGKEQKLQPLGGLLDMKKKCSAREFFDKMKSAALWEIKLFPNPLLILLPLLKSAPFFQSCSCNFLDAFERAFPN